MPSKKPILTIRTTQELIDKLQEISEKQNRSMSNMGETIIQEYIKKYEAEQERSSKKKNLEKSSISKTG